MHICIITRRQRFIEKHIINLKTCEGIYPEDKIEEKSPKKILEVSCVTRKRTEKTNHNRAIENKQCHPQKR
jgi:hypothetical protein